MKINPPHGYYLPPLIIYFTGIIYSPTYYLLISNVKNSFNKVNPFIIYSQFSK